MPLRSFLSSPSVKPSIVSISSCDIRRSVPPSCSLSTSTTSGMATQPAAMFSGVSGSSAARVLSRSVLIVPSSSLRWAQAACSLHQKFLEQHRVHLGRIDRQVDAPQQLFLQPVHARRAFEVGWAQLPHEDLEGVL